MDALSIHRKNLKDPRTLSIEDPILLLNRFASDSFTYYLPEEYVAEFKEELSGESPDSVLGIRFSPFWTDTLVVGDLASGGAAKAAGIRRKDRILTVNGKNAFPEDSAISWISDSTRVHLKVRRPRASASDTQFDVVVSQAPARFSPVWYDTLGGGRGYIAIDQFVDDSDSAYATGALVAKAAQALSGVVKSGGWIILDLRSNPGGELENALQSASVFVPKGNHIIRIRSRDVGRSTYGGVVSDSIYPSAGGMLADRKFVVLIDSETASAAEVLTSALRSNFSASKGAVLIGQKTFGKGIGQTLMETPAGAYLRITSLEILPAGTTAYGSYDGIGISPDVASTSALTDALALTANGGTTARMAAGQQGNRLIERLQAWNRSQTGFAKAGMLAYRRLETRKLR
jgi:carboxyl-terminal processing protease